MRIGVIGATGALGREIVAALAESADEPELSRNPPVLFATAKSVGETFPWVADEELVVEELNAENLRGLEVALVAVPEGASADVHKLLRPLGIVAIDASRAHRRTAPLFGEGLAAQRLGDATVVALPGAESLMVARTLAPLAEFEPLSVRAEVLRAASGAGSLGVQELAESTTRLLNGQEPEAPGFPHRLAFNVIPQAGAFAEAATEAENDFDAELARLLDRDGTSLRSAATVSWAPWFYGHFATVTVSFAQAVSVDAVRDRLRSVPGVKVLDDTASGIYPMPSLATGDEAALVGRLRSDPLDEKGIRFVVAMDNVRASALNAVAALRAVARARGAH